MSKELGMKQLHDNRKTCLRSTGLNSEFSSEWIFVTSGLYHSSLAEDIPASLVHRCALPCVSVAETAASDHHVIQSVIIFVLRISTFSQQGVAQSEETCEVNTNIRHGDQI